MFKKLFYSIVLLAVWTGWTAAWSHGANMPNPTLDAVASQVAGKPVQAHCETSSTDWQSLVGNASPGANPDYVTAFTFPTTPIVYLSPRVCIALWDTLRFGITDAGMVPFALALLSLSHEATHQAGVLNEAETDCKAMDSTVGLAKQFFGLKETIPVLKKYTYTKRFSFYWHGKRFTRTATLTNVKIVNVPNPQVSSLTSWVRYWHTVKPVNYQGVC